MAVNTGKYNRSLSSLSSGNPFSLSKPKTTKPQKGAYNKQSNFGNTISKLNSGIQSAIDKTFANAKPQESVDLNALGQSLVDAYGSSSGGGVSAGSGIDLTNILNTYRDSANAQKASISGTYNNQRQQLLDSLKRFQTDTADARKRQQRAFNSSRADLEEQAYMNSRNAMQSASARGLGGSGLQQLSQLQSQLSSNKETSNLANENQQYQDKLTQALKEQEESTNKQVNNLSQEEANKLKEIDANTSNLMAQLQYQEAVRQQEAIQAASAANASAAASSRNSAQEMQELINAATASFEANLNSAEKTIKSAYKTTYSSDKKKNKAARKSAVNEAYNTATTNLSNAYAQTGLPKQYLTAYQQQLDSLYNKYYK
mgnify:CR=1 FL=1